MSEEQSAHPADGKSIPELLALAICQFERGDVRSAYLWTSYALHDLKEFDNFVSDLAFMKARSGASTDEQLAAAIGVGRTAVANWRKRRRISTQGWKAFLDRFPTIGREL